MGDGGALMVRLRALATHLPVWGDERARVVGPDEDAVTLAVDVGRSALVAAANAVTAVVLVSRDLPLLAGGSEAVLLAGLDLPVDTRCSLVVGGAPAALDAVTGAVDGTLVIAVDVAPAAAAAAVVTGGTTGASVSPGARRTGSLPVLVRDSNGNAHDYDDVRLLRERGTVVALEALDEKLLAVAGLTAREVKGVAALPAPPTKGAAAALFALADVVGQGLTGAVGAVEQASSSAAEVGAGETVVVVHAPPVRPLPRRRVSGAADIKVSLPAYERAFDGKVRLQAGRCEACGTLDLPKRYRCSGCGSEAGEVLVPLPREATVYTAVSVHVPVPGLATPYDLAIVELGDTGVRLLAPVTGAEAGAVEIGDSGRVVLRRHAVRAGVPDYGYAFAPGAGAA
jgi:uncharacterized OB-fold protein